MSGSESRDRGGASNVRPAWWRDGLRFECTRCGLCCRGRGRVEVSDAEIEILAKHMELTVAQFREIYTREGRKGRIDLRDRANDDCIFFDEQRGCTVYEHRPAQCRTYPFWKPVLHDEETWEAEGRHCEGIGRGAVVPAEVIAEAVSRRG